MSSNKLGRYKAEITADTSKFRKELDGAGKSTDRFKNASSSLSSAVAAIDGPMGGIASRITSVTSLITKGNIVFGTMAAGIAVVGAAIGATVQHMAKLEVATAKTEAILKATGNVSGFTAGQLDTMARSVALNTLASTEGVRDAQNVLLTFKSVSGSTFQQTIGLAQDMAAVFGGDIKSATTQLGKALEDPIAGLTALKRVGVSFTEQQKEQIEVMVRAGDKAKAQKLILAELQAQVGGAGRAEASGLSGAIDTMGQKWTDLLEVFDKTTGITSKVTYAINRIAEGMGIAAEKVTAMSSASTIFNERLEKTMQLQALQAKDLSRMRGHEARNHYARVAALKKEIELLGQKLEKINAAEQSEAQKGIDAHNAAIVAQEKAAREERERQAKERRDKLRDTLKKEVDVISDSLKTRREKEDEYYQARIASLTSLSSIEPKEREEVNRLLLAEEARHLGELEKMESESAKKRRDERLKTALASPSVVAGSQLTSAVAGDIDALKTPVEKENEAHDARLDRLRIFGESNQELHGFINDQIEREHQRHSAAMTAIDMQNNQRRLAVASGMFGNLSSLMNSESRKMFNIGKIAAISGAVINGYEAVVSSYAAGSEIGGPILGAAFAATAAAATAVQIQQIKAQKFGGGGTVSAGTAGGATPGVYQPPQPTMPVGAANNQSTVQINFNGAVNGIDAAQLAEQLADHIQNTDFVMVTATSRNGQILKTA